MLDLEGRTIGKDDPDFEALRLNQNPAGSGQLTPRNVENAIRFFDFQCSAQKSVSIMAVTLGDHHLVEAHDRAAAKAFSELEKFAAIQTGQGNAKHRRTTGNLCAAAFRHDASRELDPQLHTHFVVANATWDAKSCRWLALETHDMFKAIRYAGKVYQNELAWECRRAGYQIEESRNEKGVVEGFEIKGVSSEVREHFSKRRREVEAGIEAFRAQYGREPTPSEVSVITRETRMGKLKEITSPEVLARQRSQLSSSELAGLESVKNGALHNDSSPSIGSNRSALAAARDHLFERLSVLPGHAILAEALNQKLGQVTLEGLQHNLLSDYSGIIRLTDNLTNQVLAAEFATRQGLQAEHSSVEFVNRTQNVFDSLGQIEGVPFDFKSDEQRRAVLETLANCDQVYAIRGRAGAGKTTSLQEIRKGLEAAGRHVHYLAPTSSAAETLRKEGFRNATTVSDFLSNQSQPKLRNAVLIVDEAGLQSNKQGVEILKQAQASRARVLFVGDARQHSSVEAGDFLRVLETHSQLRASELKDIRRQLVPEYNVAIRAMASGLATRGMTQLEALGWVHEGKGHYICQAAAAYLAATENGSRMNECIAVCSTWEENHRLTEAIRAELKQRGALEEGEKLSVHDPLDWTLQQKQKAANYRQGMVVQFHASAGPARRGQAFVVEAVRAGRVFLRGYPNSIDPSRCASRFTVYTARELEICPGEKILIRRNDREAGLINGQVLTVRQVGHDGAIETEEGKIIPPSFRAFCHGYVVTSHKAQGRTHDKVIVAAEQLNAKSAYVACSRGRFHCSVFTPDKAHLFSRLDEPGDRKAVFDVLSTVSARVATWFHDRSDSFRRVIHPSRKNPPLGYAQLAEPSTLSFRATPELEL
jgi:conjugative relaxase-like TrwC/TraI family protein